MPVNIYQESATDGLESEEVKLLNLINEYRSQNGLPAIAPSKALTIVANRHALDLSENLATLTHAWSDANYNPNDSSTWPAMWEAPQRLETGYPGVGYENIHGASNGFVATAESSFNGWKNSALHNAVILNQGIWADRPWQAIGVAIYKGYATLWVGEEPDPTGRPLQAETGSAPLTNFTPLNINGVSYLTATDSDDNISLTSGQLASHPGGLLALNGNDTIQGSNDPEMIAGNTGDDNLVGNNGNDSLMGGKQNDIVDGGNGNDLLRGDADRDTLNGGNDNDSLYGGKEADNLLGNAGDDVLSGDRDFDTLTGGDGKDTFVLSRGSLDIITDFANGIDLIQLPSGLSFQNIRVESNGNNALIVDNITGETLAQLNNVAPSSISATTFGESSTNTVMNNQIERLLSLTNQERTQAGLSPLTLNQKLTTSAQNHTTNMATQDFFSHTGNDGSQISDRANAVNYEWRELAENIGGGYLTPEAAMDGWMNSPGHRANILNPNLQEIGIGYYFLANDTGNVNYNHYWTQLFGTPA